MVTFANFEVPSWILLSVSFCLFIIIFLLEHFRKIALRFESGSGTRSQCSSPDCVRCSKTRSILEHGRQRLASYCNKNPKMCNDDTASLFKDIEQSLNRISQSESTTTTNVVGISTSSPNVLFIRGLREQTVMSPSEFPVLDLLTDNFNQIKLEFMHLYQSPLPETKAMWKINTTDKGKWEIAQLIDQGSHTRASLLCPLTMNFLGQISSVMNQNVFGNAAFSVVHPNTFIERHCGSTNCRIRCHLGLQVPLNCCSLEVNGTNMNWKEGGILCFNDAFPHSVSHTGKEYSGVRVVLMVDLWHPDVTESQRKLMDYIFCSENVKT